MRVLDQEKYEGFLKKLAQNVHGMPFITFERSYGFCIKTWDFRCRVEDQLRRFDTFEELDDYVDKYMEE